MTATIQKLEPNARKYFANEATADDFEMLTVDEVRSIRLSEEGRSVSMRAPMIAPPALGLFAEKENNEPVKFLMVSQRPIGWSKDLPVIKGFSMGKFNQWGRPLLWHHNIEQTLMPLGRMTPPSKSEKLKDGTPAMTGYAVFMDRGQWGFADQIQNAVRGGWLVNGSVGFDIVEARSPKDEKEAKKLGLGKWSLIMEKTELKEFSITPIGRDEKAGKTKMADGRSFDQAYCQYAESLGADPSEIAVVRRQMQVAQPTPLQVLSPSLSIAKGIEAQPAIDYAVSGPAEDRTQWGIEMNGHANQNSPREVIELRSGAELTTEPGFEQRDQEARRLAAEQRADTLELRYAELQARYDDLKSKQADHEGHIEHLYEMQGIDVHVEDGADEGESDQGSISMPNQEPVQQTEQLGADGAEDLDLYSMLTDEGWPAEEIQIALEHAEDSAL